ncbi:MAG: hypothetical protein K0S56_770 [Microvirga sp.]|jgi:hypothetical protein|nr:hypothetical protein [Microvirga sp.]
MRYFFNLASDYDAIPDEIGMELANLQLAIDGARRAIDELSHEFPSSTRDWRGWRLEITDEFGHVLETLILRADEDPTRSN